ncbi:MAG: DUF1801 domain-containing protein [Gracilimonas sp.]|uniref:DUF1801 domain-containing protein n=1 Tax=Gracilimonas TaxID=649462 RepID=UPI001B239888|nr:DUF1801 domain-containing protein [Gracilimonas sp.]MBO6586234.1 DUF1801 domain-containing protein [Gracilimonas sp.]MBO6614891.1 DUF1801 domain-containing protein [Gracilimonas sp.]
MDNGVKEKFEAYPEHIRVKMERLRGLIYEVAGSTEGVGELEETLKWSEPAYLTKRPKSGTTVRIDWKEKSPDQIGMYVSCNTSLIETYRSMFGDELEFEGNRAILLPADTELPEKELRICIQMALRYHLDK